MPVHVGPAVLEAVSLGAGVHPGAGPRADGLRRGAADRAGRTRRRSPSSSARRRESCSTPGAKVVGGEDREGDRAGGSCPRLDRDRQRAGRPDQRHACRGRRPGSDGVARGEGELCEPGEVRAERRGGGSARPAGAAASEGDRDADEEEDAGSETYQSTRIARDALAGICVLCYRLGGGQRVVQRRRIGAGGVRPAVVERVVLACPRVVPEPVKETTDCAVAELLVPATEARAGRGPLQGADGDRVARAVREGPPACTVRVTGTRCRWCAPSRRWSSGLCVSDRRPHRDPHQQT